MKLEDILIPAPEISCEVWQLGSMIKHELGEGGIALIFCNEERGAGRDGVAKDFFKIREYLYRLSVSDFEIPIYDLGDLKSGKTLEDTHCILKELVLACCDRGIIPVIIGGGNDLAHAIFSALNQQERNLNYTQISNEVALSSEGETINDKNFLYQMLYSKDFSIRNYAHLAYQKHLNELQSVKLLENIDFEVVRLSEMMNTTENTEPYFREAHLVTLNCDAVESFEGAFSINSQVNGLNRREICAYMSETGLGQNLKAVGIFNFNSLSQKPLHHQLLAQMVWYLLEGINIQKTHPKERDYEYYTLLLENFEYRFKKDTFSGLWYFEKSNGVFVPCSRADYDNAKKGILNKRLR